MVREIMIPGVAWVVFSDRLTNEEIDAAIVWLKHATPDERYHAISQHEIGDYGYPHASGITVTVNWWSAGPPPTQRELHEVLTARVRDFWKFVEMRREAFRLYGPPYVYTPGAATELHHCVSCAWPLLAFEPQDIPEIFGRCLMCRMALVQLFKLTPPDDLPATMVQ